MDDQARFFDEFLTVTDEEQDLYWKGEIEGKCYLAALYSGKSLEAAIKCFELCYKEGTNDIVEDKCEGCPLAH